jgi:hypothetical protein
MRVSLRLAATAGAHLLAAAMPAPAAVDAAPQPAGARQLMAGWGGGSG